MKLLNVGEGEKGRDKTKSDVLLSHLEIDRWYLPKLVSWNNQRRICFLAPWQYFIDLNMGGESPSIRHIFIWSIEETKSIRTTESALRSDRLSWRNVTALVVGRHACCRYRKPRYEIAIGPARAGLLPDLLINLVEKRESNESYSVARDLRLRPETRRPLDAHKIQASSMLSHRRKRTDSMGFLYLEGNVDA